MNRELIYLLLIFGLLVVPRALQRFSVPAPLTCLMFGIAAMFSLGERANDPVVVLLATLGISTLFLFAGLEVDLQALRRAIRPLIGHLLLRVLSLAVLAWVAWRCIGLVLPGTALSWQAAGLLALALLTSSTGFIIDTLGRLGLDEDERFWVTNKAIAAEFLALGALFVLLQAGDLAQFGISTAGLAGLLVGLPLLFIAMGRWVVPYAPGSEFSLLVMVGLIAAFATYKLGVYYLVGAFVAGLTASLLQRRMPRLASHENLHAVRLFASFFVPFYFFHAGIQVPAQALSWKALGLGLALTAIVLPLRIAGMWVQRRLMFRGQESSRNSLRVSLALCPTLIFTLVLAGILRARFQIPDELFGALLLYTSLTTLLPSLVFRAPLNVEQAAGPQPASDQDAAAEAPAPVQSDAVVQPGADAAAPARA